MADEDDKTRIVPRETEVTNTLPPGWRLHEFELQKVVGEGGFGIVYLAQDTQLERRVAVKEYMPGALAARQRDWSIAVKSERHHDTFSAGMRSFINEAKLLAQFDHPALVKVYRFWEANGTAYMAMPFYEGPTLKEHFKARAANPPDEGWLKQLLVPLMAALERLHTENCYHRDIAPDNVILLKGDVVDVHPLLLDFGAARRIIGDMTQALTVILKPGYAPVEQYAEVPSLKQGPWTDVYALAAVLYAAINGRPPLPSVGRMIKDDMKPATEIGAGRYSVSFLSAIDAGLAVLPEQRPPSIAAFRELLFADPSIITQVGDDQATRIAVRSPAGTATMPSASRPVPLTSMPAPSPVPAPSPGSKGKVIAAVVALVVLGGAGAGYWLTRPPPAPAPVADVTPPGTGTGTGTPATGTPSTGTPSTGTSSTGTPSTGTPSTGTPATDPGPITPPVTPPTIQPQPIPTTSQGWLEAAFATRSDSVGMSAGTDLQRMRISRDKLRFRVQSRVDGFVYVLFSGTDNSPPNLLFPNAIDKNNRIKAGQELTLPRPGWSITAGGPAGTDHIVVIVSPNKRDFSGLVPGDPFSEFDVKTLGRGTRADALAGTANCAGQVPCDAAFGAAKLDIEETN